MYYLGLIFIISMTLGAFTHTALGEDRENAVSEVLDIMKDSESELYAIMDVDGGKDKIYTKGDIFYSRDISRCFRIQDIKKNIIILKDVNSERTIAVKLGGRVPLEGTDIIFKKAVSKISWD